MRKPRALGAKNDQQSLLEAWSGLSGDALFECDQVTGNQGRGKFFAKTKSRSNDCSLSSRRTTAAFLQAVFAYVQLLHPDSTSANYICDACELMKSQPNKLMPQFPLFAALRIFSLTKCLKLRDVSFVCFPCFGKSSHFEVWRFGVTQSFPTRPPN